MNKVDKSKKAKIFDIISFVGVFVFFGAALICALFKFAGSKFNLFGSRYDVVLTDSMSQKNEKYKDFLEGHDDQFQAFDLVKSKKIANEKDLQLYDVVLYKDRYVGTNMHRIVDVVPNHEETLTFSLATKTSLNNNDGIVLNNVESMISSNEICFDSLELTTYSTLEKRSNFYFYFGIELIPEVTYEDSGEGFFTTYKIKRNSLSPVQIKISHAHIYDYSKEVITSVKINSTIGDIECNASKVFEKENDIVGNFNVSYMYEIRGDYSNTSDGLYSFDEIEAKVVKNIPKLGYLIRFLGSLWGGLMFILLGVIFLVFDILMNHFNKKEALASGNDAESNKKSSKKSAKNNESERKVVEKTTKSTPSNVERVNGRFVSKKALEKPSTSSSSSRRTKENNPHFNKKSNEGGKK